MNILRLISLGWGDSTFELSWGEYFTADQSGVGGILQLS